MSVGDASQRMRLYRERLRARGLKPVQIWVHDTQAPAFRDDLRKQIKRLNPAAEQDALDFIENVAEFPEAENSE
ncbi:MAG: antitoxin MazE family protein [Coraliomargarita sp.]